MDRILSVALLSGLGAGVLAFASSPAAAQETTRFQVLVPALHTADANPRWGRNVADDLRRHISTLPTHDAVDQRALRNPLREFGLREEDLSDCITARQVAMQMRAQIVLCGEYRQADGGHHVDARFVSAGSGEEFAVPAFVTGDHRQAAQQIFSAFDEYINLLRQTQFCVEYATSEQWEDALRNCEQALAINPNAQEALYTKGRAMMEMGRLEEALAVIEQLLHINPMHDDAMLTAGILSARLGNHERSRALFSEYLDMNPGNVDVRLSVATDLANAGDPEGALRIAMEGMEAETDNLTLREYVGHFALAAAEQLASSNGDRQHPDATRYYETALENYRAVFAEKGDEAEETMLRNMLVTLIQLGRHDDAVRLGDEVLAVKPDAASIWWTHAGALQRAGRLDDALAALDRTERLAPGEYPDLDLRRAVWVVQTGNLDRARQAIRRAIDSGANADDLARSVFAFGYNERFQRNQHGEALRFFEVAREFATQERTRAMAEFWTGWIHYQRARQMQEPQTLQSAQQSLPVFRSAKQHFQRGAAWARAEVPTYQDVLAAVDQYIDIQEAIIRRGR